MNEKTIRLQNKIRRAIQSMHDSYKRNPWIFMTEADIQCFLYARLEEHTSKALKAKVEDYANQRRSEPRYAVLTRPLHAELSSPRRQATEFVDLCLIRPAKTTFWVPKSTYDRRENTVPVWGWEWLPEKSIGIEIKFNRYIPKTSVRSRKTGRLHETSNWSSFYERLVRDFAKLKRYHRGWLILVDHHSLFSTKREWRGFVDRLIRAANYGSAKKTLNAYYLSPKLGQAFAYRPMGGFF